jgi:hypothetical protein
MDQEASGRNPAGQIAKIAIRILQNPPKLPNIGLGEAMIRTWVVVSRIIGVVADARFLVRSGGLPAALSPQVVI